MLRAIITGSGSYIPASVRKNEQFLEQDFYTSDGERSTTPSGEIVAKLKEITGIEERRYVTDELDASDIGALAARQAIEDSGINSEEIDQLIVAHNFGNVRSGSVQSVAVPSLACLIKNKLGIRNPNCIAYDILFGCPGWLQGVIQADAFFQAGMAKKALVIGTETLSRVIDRYDRDSMIFSDGAGATVLEYREAGDRDAGILSSAAETHSFEEVNFINMGASFCPAPKNDPMYIKMQGRKVYEFAMKHVPVAIKACLDRSGVNIADIKKIFIHQANEKMDDAILARFYKLCGVSSPPPGVMPMSIQWLGNSSVATIPTLFDLVVKGKLPPHEVHQGDVVIFASVGAGMTINAVCYRC